MLEFEFLVRVSQLGVRSEVVGRQGRLWIGGEPGGCEVEPEPEMDG